MLTVQTKFLTNKHDFNIECKHKKPSIDRSMYLDCKYKLQI